MLERHSTDLLSLIHRSSKTLTHLTLSTVLIGLDSVFDNETTYPALEYVCLGTHSIEMNGNNYVRTERINSNTLACVGRVSIGRYIAKSCDKMVLFSEHMSRYTVSTPTNEMMRFNYCTGKFFLFRSTRVLVLARCLVSVGELKRLVVMHSSLRLVVFIVTETELFDVKMYTYTKENLSDRGVQFVFVRAGSAHDADDRQVPIRDFIRMYPSDITSFACDGFL